MGEKDVFWPFSNKCIHIADGQSHLNVAQNNKKTAGSDPQLLLLKDEENIDCR